MASPLADRIRPQTIDEIVGQRHLLAPGKALRRIIESGTIPNLVFYGPPGVGKTTLASIIAKQTKKKLVKLNGTTASSADIREVVGLNETIFDISITANRADCQSILGIAREVAAVLGKPLKMPATDYTCTETTDPRLSATVEAPDLCPR